MAETTTTAVGTIGGYSIVRREPLEALEGSFLELEHQRTGARHVHIECTDDNNAFAVFFPTTPRDSTGVAHILEHVVLAGSQRFPVRDPFFSMTRRSLATFMNAFTSAGWTMYPFSTRNAKDFMNLLDVYLDATFFPRLAEDSFKQEGIRFEFEAPEDPKSGLRYKGVVFNEMKGALASPQAAMQRAVGKALFPGLTYEHISGGDPENIPDLTWQKLRDFHAVHYHPSNAYFYTYGNQPLEMTLEAIERNVLSRFERIKVDTEIPDVARFKRPTTLSEVYPLGPGEDGTKRSEALIAWVTVHTSDSFRVLAMRVLSEVLLGNSGSPLRKALIDSRLGTAMADGSGLQDDYREAVFGAGLKDISAGDADKVQQVVLDTLAQLAREGVDPEQVDAVIHRLEFEKRERSNAGFPYALKVLFSCLPSYNYGGDTYSALNFDADLERLEAERKQGRWFEDLIRAELLDNQHRALLVISPDPELEDRQRKRELERLGLVEASLSDQDRQRIVADALRLKAAQDAKQDLSVLPTLGLDDIPMKFDPIASESLAAGAARVEFYPLPTNGVTYLDIRTDFAVLGPELQDLLPLFSRVLTQSGAAGQDYAQIARRIAAHTGGIGAAAQVQSLAAVEDFVQSFIVSGKALDRKLVPFVELLGDLMARLEIDPPRLKEIIAETATRLESSLANLGLQFAILLAQAKLTSEGALNERLQGIRMLREKGGAYGGFAQASTGAGFFYLGSYRDPNVVHTYEVYDRAARWAIDSPIEPEALKEAILGACGDVDPLESPDIKGRREAVNRLTGFTLQERERFKQRLLQVTANDLTRVSSSYLAAGRELLLARPADPHRRPRTAREHQRDLGRAPRPAHGPVAGDPGGDRAAAHRQAHAHARGDGGDRGGRHPAARCRGRGRLRRDRTGDSDRHPDPRRRTGL